jgi:type II secretory pathway component GspD/PulD (secretin)
MTTPGRNRCRAFLLGLALGLPWATPAAAIEPRWPEVPYNYLVLDQDLPAVLEQFSRQMGVPVRLSDAIEPHRLRGKLGAPSPKAFLQWLCDSYDLVWYFDGSVLHIIRRSELRNTFLELGRVPLADLRQRLAASGFAEERFPLTPSSDPAFASLAAPPAYTTLVQQVLASIKSDAEPRRVPAPVVASPPASAPVAAQSSTAPSPSTAQAPGSEHMRSSGGSGKVEDQLLTAEPSGDGEHETAVQQRGRRKVMVFRGGG